MAAIPRLKGEIMAPVRVIGAGIIGIACAIQLQEAGHDVEIVAERWGNDTTSAVAGAIWYPYHVGPVADAVRWGEVTLAELRRLAREVPEAGVRIKPGVESTLNPTEPHGWTALMPDFARVAPPTGAASAWAMSLPVIDMPVFLDWLQRRFLAAGGHVREERLDTIPDDGVLTVLACGLGARELLGDTEIFPLRGQVTLLEQVGLKEWWMGEDAEGPIYVFPRDRDIVVGGSLEPGNASIEVNEAQAARILERGRAAVPAIRDAKVIRSRAGLRPYRAEVRLERITVGSTPVITCYGHGGGGVTLSWGCARDVVELVGAETSGVG